MSARHTLALASLLFVAVCAHAEGPDSLVRWNELVFSTPFEEKSFQGFLKKKDADYLRVFLGNAPDADKYVGYFNDKIDATLREIETSGALKKRNDKKVKAIYEVVHKKFLSKYEMENRFYEIMANGNYNCVTATALYAFFFEKLGIPYNIMEKPTHVYLVAYPDAENILVETTTPLFGFTSYNPEFKASYVSTLKKQKIIGAEETVGSNTDELFNKYFFGTDNISLTELVGIHYMNDGLYLRDKEENTAAYDQMMKAYLFYPCPKSEYLLMSLGATLVDAKTTDPLTKASLIGRLSRFEKIGVDPETIQAEFQRLTQQILGKNNDKELYAKCYAAMMANVDNPELANELKYLYNFENGRIYYNQGNYVKAKPFFSAAMEAQPRNADLSGPFIACLAQSLRNERRNRAIVDTLEVYRKRFPALDEYPNFVSMLALAYAGQFGDAYEKNDPVEGEKYKKLFEDLYEKGSVNIVSTDVIGRAYSEAAVYYFRKGQKTKARAMIDRGLEIVPGEYQLKTRKQMIGG